MYFSNRMRDLPVMTTTLHVCHQAETAVGGEPYNNRQRLASGA